jgi:hypothetical protein
MKTTDEPTENRWKHVPPDTRYIAMDGNGQWYWFTSHPVENHAIRIWQSGKKFGMIEPQPKPNHPWIDSLEERP